MRFSSLCPSGVILALLVAVAFLLISCTKEEADPAPAVQISSFSPSSAPRGAQVTISGANFGATAAQNLVTFNGQVASVTAATSSHLTVVVPADATSGRICIRVGDQSATSTLDFTVILPPVLSAFSPLSGVAGTQVTLEGSNFSSSASENQVFFNGNAATVLSASTSQLVVEVPATATSGIISLQVLGQTAVASVPFTIPEPVLNGFSPEIGAATTSVTIRGSNFSTLASYNLVRFNGSLATVTQATATTLTAIVPAAASTGKITVQVGPHTATSATDFLICPNAELLISDLAISGISAAKTSLNYSFTLTNVGATPADLSKIVIQAYVSADNAFTNTDPPAGGRILHQGGSYMLAAGQSYPVNGSAYLQSGTTETYPFLILHLFDTPTGAVQECNTENNIVISPIP